MQSLEFLLEYDRAKTAATFGQKILAVAAKDRWLINEIIGIFPEGLSFAEMARREPTQVLDAILAVLERGDPTQHKEYSQAIAKMYGNGLSKAEDIVSTLADYLAKFDKLKRKKKIQPPRNDFNRYRSLEDFMDVVDEYPDEEAEAQPEVKQNATELYRDSNLIVTVPNDVEAACYYGQGTRWCTAGKNNNMYDYYTRGDRPLYIVIPRKPAYPGEKYQFHFETKQFMNEQDRQIGEEGMAKLVQRFPQLPKILQHPAEKYSYAPLLSNEYKQVVKDSVKDVSTEVTAMVNQYQDRIVAFGLKSLREYGIRISPDAEQQLTQAGSSLVEQEMQLINKTLWSSLLEQPGAERNEDRVEVLISSSSSLQQLAKESEAGQILIDAIAATGQKIHKDALPHIRGLVLTDPISRFLMKQIPKRFTARLQEQGHAL